MITERNFFFVAVGLLVLVIVFLLIVNSKIINVDKEIINTWAERQDYLINICEIDFNEYLRQQQLKDIKDLNNKIYEQQEWK